MIRIRTGYSFRSAVGNVDDVVARLKELEFKYAPITDRASAFGWTKWDKACRKAGLIPIFGVELAVTPSINAKKPSVDYWTFLATDALFPLNTLIELATSQFRYEPLLTYEQALSFGGIKIIGSRSNLELIPKKLPKSLFVALSPSVSKGYANLVRERKLAWLPASDNRYVKDGDQGFYEVTCGRGASVQSYPQHILSPKEWEEAVRDVCSDKERKEAVAKALLVLKSCKATLLKGVLLSPKKPKTLRKMCEEGAKRLGINLKDKIYKARLDRELKLIEEKNFEDYFYIIADAVSWARERMLVGPARGSSCGSLVCYLLRITTIDPIPYGLIFERFIDVNRNDLPDIDIDFSDVRRHLVFEYVEGKYGKERVARLGTVAVFRPRSALNEAGGALDIPKWMTSKCIDSIIERSSGDARALQTLEDTLKDTEAGRELFTKHPEIIVAGRMEGHPQNAGTHAAGIVLTELPVRHYVAVDSRTGVTHCDKKDAEELGLLKIDALGLKQLSIFEDALTLAGLPLDFLDGIDMNDKKAFDVLNRGHFAGVFQFMGPALQSIVKQVKIEGLEDIISITALARPGPMASGGTNTWIKRKRKEEPIAYPHEAFRPSLETTLGVVCYQEQVMTIGRDIGDLSWEDVTALRKAMSKSLGAEFFNQYGDRFKAGAMKKGIPADTLDKIWDDLCAYGSWAFNRSHSVAYGVISYWCCWMKAHYPIEFAAASLSHEEDDEKKIKTLRELDKEGVKYIAVDPKLSIDRWTAGKRKGKKVLVGPLSSIKGVGPKMVASILAARASGAPLPAKAEKLLANPVTPIDSLYPIRDRIKIILPDPAAKKIHTPPRTLAECVPTGKDSDVLVFCVLEQIKPRDENEEVLIAKRGGQRLTGEPTAFLNLTIKDDTDQMFAKISRWDYAELGRKIVDAGRAGKAIWCLKGIVPRDFRMIRVKGVRYIGDMDVVKEEKQDEGE